MSSLTKKTVDEIKTVFLMITQNKRQGYFISLYDTLKWLEVKLKEYKGIKYLKPLYLAIQKKQVLQIKFKGFKDAAYKTFEFHPHILKQYNRRWFVFGYNKTAERRQYSIPLDERLIGFSVLEDLNYIESQKTTLDIKNGKKI